MPTHAMIDRALPSRHEKRRVARSVGLRDESLIYKWTAPRGTPSARPNPLDYVGAILDHACTHHVDAAMAIAQFVNAKVEAALGARGSAVGVGLPDLLITLQPGAEREALEAIVAMSSSVRQVALRGEYDAHALLREVEEGERALHAAAAQLRAGIQATACLTA